VLSPAAMLDRLERRLPLLGARTAPERQRTLEATIAWSYELLTPAERRIFARLSVFRGGFSLEAAETVCDADLDTIASLVDKSLLRQRDDRLLMLQTIRDYANDRLTASPEADEIAQRHAGWILTLFQESAPQLYGRDQTDRLRALDREQPNLRAALDHAVRAGDRTFALRLLAACWNCWYLRGHYAEGLARLDAALSVAESVDAELRRDVLNGLVVFAWFRGRPNAPRRSRPRACACAAGCPRTAACCIRSRSAVCRASPPAAARPALMSDGRSVSSARAAWARTGAQQSP
jgi:predicted ATPase